MKSYKTFNISIIFTLFLILLNTETKAQYAKGCDVGWLSQMEASGKIFYDKNGVKKDLLDILKSYDINSIRLRVWVNPANGYCNKTDVINQALRCKNKGFRILIDFHYSDSWADPGKQTKPAAWTSYSFTQLKQAVATHTNDVLSGLKSAGVYPEWVQVGNETNNGMLWEDGKASVSMSNFAQLITSGYDAVKAVFPATKVIVHISNGYDNGLFRWMFDGLKNNTAKWDVIGMSLYPEQGTANQTWQTIDPQCLTNMNDMANRYGKEVMLCEVGISWSDANTAYSYISDIMAKNKSVTGGKGIGIFYWEPECYNGWQGYQKGAFDNSGKPTHAMDAFLEGASTANQAPTIYITSPSNNTTYSTTASIKIDVSASDPDGSISKVEFYANGGTRIGTNNISPYSFNWTGAAAGTYVLTAIAYDNEGQITLSSNITIIITSNCVPPLAPTVTSPITYCQGEIASVLTANGTGLKWYTVVTNGTSTSNAPIPSTTTAGNTTYYVSQTTNACESTRATITVTVNALSIAPTATSPITYCQEETASALTANGTGLKWYTTATGGTSASTAPIPSTTTAGNTTYYVSQTTNACESTRATIIVNVNALPIAPTVTSPITYCQGEIASVLTANGTGLKWYTVVTNGTSTSNAPIPSTTTAGNTTYYVSQTTNACESTRATITVTVNALSIAPTATSPITYCQGETASALTANGTGLKWYTVATNGTSTSNAPIPSTTTAGNTTYYVSQTTNACESIRALVTVTVNALPLAPTVTSPITYCQGETASALTANGTGLKWYTIATGGTIASAAPIPSTTTAGNTTYYVSQTTNACESIRALIVANVNAKPTVSNAGLIQHISGTSGTLAANTPTIGAGTWTQITGTGTFSNIHSALSTVSGLSLGINTFRWTISNGSCAPSSNDISIIVGNSPVTNIIIGPSQVLSGTQKTYSIPNSNGSTYTWSVPADASIVSGQGTNILIVQFGNTGGAINVIETNTYGTATSSIGIAVGNAPAPPNITGPSAVEIGTTTYTYSVAKSPNTSYSWSVPQGAVIQSGQTSSSITVIFPVGTNSGDVGVTASNDYGSSSSSLPVAISTTTTSILSHSINENIIIVPNPFVNETSIIFQTKNKEIYTVLKVINMHGDIVYESSGSNALETIHIGENLTSGIYIIVIMYENESYVMKVEKIQ
jgi:arabinogalactan endo-1,4-beta-galactosidase